MAKILKVALSGQAFKDACKRADAQRMLTGLGIGSNILGQSKQGFDNPIIAGNVLHTPKGSNKVLDVTTIIDALGKDRSAFVASMFKDASIITSKSSLLIASPEITSAVALTRKNARVFVKMIEAMQAYLVSEYGKLDAKQAKDAIKHDPIKYK